MEQKDSVTRYILNSVWAAQVAYNQAIREQERPDDREYWAKQYLLGLTSEIDEVLNEMNWKRHRKGHKTIDRINLARELADLTKYTWCLWELFGFSVDDMLHFVMDKTDELKVQYSQEFDIHDYSSTGVVITDIDGTLGDWRSAFRKWVSEQTGMMFPDDPRSSMTIEQDLKIPYPEYLKLKDTFESSGGYTLLEPYPDALTAIWLLAEPDIGIPVISYTARPARKYSRIWSDTWHWLGIHGIAGAFNEVNIGGEERIARGCALMDSGVRTVLLEDDPGLALRAANAGLSVVLRDHPYNQGLEHSNIYRTPVFSAQTIQERMR